VALVLAGYILHWSGFDAALGGGQSDRTIFWMRILLAFVPAAGLLLSITLAWLYPITQQRAYEMQAELKARHGAGGEGAAH
jgi:GPH family glycoside/pentoside/hexuronide:cation symporter